MNPLPTPAIATAEYVNIYKNTPEHATSVLQQLYSGPNCEEISSTSSRRFLATLKTQSYAFSLNLVFTIVSFKYSPTSDGTSSVLNAAPAHRMAPMGVIF